jgi:hypothetical protein
MQMIGSCQLAPELMSTLDDRGLPIDLCRRIGIGKNDWFDLRQTVEITPEMLERGMEAFIQWRAYNADVLELGGLGDVSALTTAIWPIFANSCKSSSDIDKSD